MCDRCETIHDDEFDAEDCCKPEVWDVWVCVECGQDYELRQEADECCPHTTGLDHPIGWQTHINTLESAGQLRLLTDDDK